MKKKILFVFMVLAMLLTSVCYSSKSGINADGECSIGWITPGITTSADLIAAYGQPIRKNISSDGSGSMLWAPGGYVGVFWDKGTNTEGPISVVYCINYEFNDMGLYTPRGLHIGMTLEEAVSLYGIDINDDYFLGGDPAFSVKDRLDNTYLNVQSHTVKGGMRYIERIEIGLWDSDRARSLFH